MKGFRQKFNAAAVYAVGGGVIVLNDTTRGEFCLSETNRAPPSPSPNPATLVLQMWAKPQPMGATAVLVVNDAPYNATVTINMTELRYAHGDAPIEVLDIWAGASAGTLAAGTTSFVSPSFGHHDSVFYLFYPKGSGAEERYLI